MSSQSATSRARPAVCSQRQVQNTAATSSVDELEDTELMVSRGVETNNAAWCAFDTLKHHSSGARFDCRSCSSASVRMGLTMHHCLRACRENTVLEAVRSTLDAPERADLQLYSFRSKAGKSVDIRIEHVRSPFTLECAQHHDEVIASPGLDAKCQPAVTHTQMAMRHTMLACTLLCNADRFAFTTRCGHDLQPNTDALEQALNDIVCASCAQPEWRLH